MGHMQTHGEEDHSNGLDSPREEPLPGRLRSSPRTEALILVMLLLADAIGFLLIPALRGFLGFLSFILLPGAVMAMAFGKGRVGSPKSFPEAAIASLLLGLAAFIGIGWMLAKEGAFTVANLAIGVAVLAIVVAYWRRDAIASWTLLDARKDKWGISYAALMVVLAGALTAPILVAQSNGILVGGDTATYANIATTLLRLHAWPTLAQTNLLSVPPATYSPGIAIVYAFLGGIMSATPIYVTSWISIPVILLCALAMEELVARFTANRLLRFSIPVMWVIAFPFSSPLLSEILPGYSPDTTLGIPFLLYGLALVVDQFQMSPAPSQDEMLRAAVKLASISAGVALLSQLIWLFWGLALGLAFFILLRHRLVVSLGIILPSLVVVIGVFFSVFSLSSLQQTTDVGQLGSSGSALNAVSVSFLVHALEAFGTFAIIVSVFGLALWLVVALKKWEPVVHNLGLWLWLVLSAAVVGFLTLTPVGSLVVGISYNRFPPYLQLLLIPFAVLGFSGLINRAGKRSTLKVLARCVPVFIAVILAVGGVGLIPTIDHEVSKNSAFGPEEIAAAQWLASHPNGTIVADANGGANCVAMLQDFVHSPVVIRDEFALYADIYLTPSPYNQSAIYANAVLTDPTAENALLAQRAFNFTYYYLIQEFDAPEVAAFSQLDYFPLVYSNSAVDVFMFSPSRVNESYFIPAVSFVAASDQIVSSHDSSALDSPVSLPPVDNVIESLTSENLNGSRVTYDVSVGAPGRYALLIHQDVYRPGAWTAIVSSGGTQFGNTTFKQVGWSFSLPVLVDATSPTFTLTLTFFGFPGVVTPIDYLILTS